MKNLKTFENFKNNVFGVDTGNELVELIISEIETNPKNIEIKKYYMLTEDFIISIGDEVIMFHKYTQTDFGFIFDDKHSLSIDNDKLGEKLWNICKKLSVDYKSPNLSR